MIDKRNRKSVLFALEVALLLDIVFTSIAGGYLLSQVSHVNRCKVVTEATVVDNQLRYSSSHGGTFSYYPVYQYFADDREYVAVSSYGTKSTVVPVGDKVELHYNWDNPGEYYITNDSSVYPSAVVFGCLGISLLVLSFIFTVLRFREMH